MRAIMLVSLFLTGAVCMNAVAEEPQEKKEPKDPYKEFVTVRRWNEADKKFQNPHKEVMAFRREDKGAVVTIAIRSADTAGGTPQPKTEIIDADGNTYVVTKVEGGAPKYVCYVVKKTQ